MLQRVTNSMGGSGRWAGSQWHCSVRAHSTRPSSCKPAVHAHVKLRTGCSVHTHMSLVNMRISIDLMLWHVGHTGAVGLAVTQQRKKAELSRKGRGRGAGRQSGKKAAEGGWSNRGRREVVVRQPAPRSNAAAKVISTRMCCGARPGSSVRGTMAFLKLKPLSQRVLACSCEILC